MPEALADLGISGFISTSDGALIAGEPHVAANWFPCNDHPTDRAAYTFELTVPEGLEVVATGALAGQSSRDGWTTWIWDAPDPMATYMAGVSIGDLAINAYEQDGIRYWDGIDAELVTPITPPTGAQFMVSQQADSAFKRLTRTISVPAEGATISFSVIRDTEIAYDFFFVEAHTVGLEDWTTLPDSGGFATQDVGFDCPYWHDIHPSLRRYQTASDDPALPCTPAGTTGEWWAASGSGSERWTIDLARYAGTEVEVSLSYASDDSVQLGGVFVDDITLSTGAGSTSFEADGDELDGWSVPGAPPGNAANANDWRVGTRADAPPPRGAGVLTTLARQPEVLAFLGEQFGPYPFDVAGAIITTEEIGFALETQTRPIYPSYFVDGDVSILVHELAHQWFGDSLALDAWQHVWLNEGFATYAQWLWNESEGVGTAQEMFESYLTGIPADDPFWSLTIGDPGPDHLFDSPVYDRGALTLHELRVTVGDEAFFDILRTWACVKAGTTVTTDDFIDVAETVSGQDLTELFDIWLFTPTRPDVGIPAPTGIPSEVALLEIAAPLRSGAHHHLPAGRAPKGAP